METANPTLLSQPRQGVKNILLTHFAAHGDISISYPVGYPSHGYAPVIPTGFFEILMSSNLPNMTGLIPQVALTLFANPGLNLSGFDSVDHWFSLRLKVDFP
ncbi:MAG: hypothetical protein LUH22_05810 [Bacteroides sp.]|nr:hypothetical protein [Bacteroides sp.]